MTAVDLTGQPATIRVAAHDDRRLTVTLQLGEHIVARLVRLRPAAAWVTVLAMTTTYADHDVTIRITSRAAEVLGRAMEAE